MKSVQAQSLSGKTVGVVGLGASGMAAARLALAHGAQVLGFDESPAEIGSSTGDQLTRCFFAEEALCKARTAAEEIDFVVLSPGVPPRSMLLQVFLRARTSVVAEIEFASRYCALPLLAITGTNGKTTTTGLAAHILNTCGYFSSPCGNYGVPFSEIVMPGRSERIVTVEVSSFQLEAITSFRPRVAVWLNFAADHLDRYEDLEAYRAAKMRIFEFQIPGDHVVVREGESLGLRDQEIHQFSSVPGSRAEMVLDSDGDRILYRGTKVASLSATRLRGCHNAENVMAAMLAVHNIAGVSFDEMSEALVSFRASPHRCELVAQVGGVDYINDSKATNVHALESSLCAFSRPVVLLVGGKDKGLDYSSLPALLAGRVRHVVTFGEIGEALREQIVGSIDVEVEVVANMNSAVQAAHAAAVSGDIVLLSPGTSSFDMYDGYGERGEAFRRAVDGLSRYDKVAHHD